MVDPSHSDRDGPGLALNGAVWIMLAGAAGATIRFALKEALGGSDFPWHTLVANVLGCLILIVSRALANQPRHRRLWGLGFAGGLSTFSTMSVEAVLLIREDRIALASSYLLISVLLGIAVITSYRSIVRP